MWALGTAKLFAVLFCMVFANDRYHPEPRGPRASFVPQSEFARQYWENDAQEAIRKLKHSGYGRSVGKARNVVMFLGDGMSIPTVNAARALLGQRNNKTGEEAQLSFEAFPTVGMSKVLYL